jgi:WD40 repeat protein
MPELPATMELLVPRGATVTVDGKDAGSRRTFEYVEFDSVLKTRRVEVAVKFSDGTEEQRTVNLPAGGRLRVPVNLPAAGSPTRVPTGTVSALTWVRFSPDGRWLVTVSENNSIVLWDLVAGRTVRSFNGQFVGAQAVVFSPDSKRLLTALDDSTVALWEVESGRLVRKFRGHAARATSAAFSRDGKKLVTGSSDKTAILWDVETGARIQNFVGHRDDVGCVDLSPDGRLIATGSGDNNAMLWNAETGESLFTLRSGETVTQILFSPDGKKVVGSSWANKADIWDTATGKVLGTIRSGPLDVHGLAFLSDGRTFLSAGKDGKAKLWETDTAQFVREFAGHGADVHSVSASPDGRLAATASRDGTVKLFDITTGAEIATLVSGVDAKNWVAVAPDGLFDGSDAGRRMAGYRFTGKLPSASVEQFFGQYYHAGLLAELVRGERPMAAGQMARRVPPSLKIVAPKVRSTTEEQITLVVEATDQGGGVSAPKIFNNGARLALEPAAVRNGNVVRFSFPLPLAAGSNQIRIIAAAEDGSWEATPVETELSSSRPASRKSRLFVVAVDTAEPRSGANSPAGGISALAELVQRRSAGLYERVDVIPVLGKEATRARIEETLRDIASLSQPQDTVMLLARAPGALIGERLYLAPQDLRLAGRGWEADFTKQGIDADELVALLGTTNALNRVLVFDAADPVLPRDGAAPSDFALRGAVERWARDQGVYAIAACTPAAASPAESSSSGLLSGLLIESAAKGQASRSGASKSGSGKTAIDVMEWFNAAAESATPVSGRRGPEGVRLQQSSKAKGFPLLAGTR